MCVCMYVCVCVLLPLPHYLFNSFRCWRFCQIVAATVTSPRITSMTLYDLFSNRIRASISACLPVDWSIRKKR